MDFTELYKQSASLVSFSPGAHFILTAVQDRLIVRRADTFQITRSWLLDASPSPTHAILASSTSTHKGKAASSALISSENNITHAAWSSDSEFLLAACAKKGVLHVYKLEDEKWTTRIDAGAEGWLGLWCHNRFVKINMSSIGLVKAEWAPDGRTILCFSEWGVGASLCGHSYTSLTIGFSCESLYGRL